jgi:hypothetical protein
MKRGLIAITVAFVVCGWMLVTALPTHAAKAKAAPETCASHGVNPTYGPGVPYKSTQWIDGKCWCGAKDGVTPKQAQQAGWYASCDNGQCICNFTSGTIASNACCNPGKDKPKSGS